MIDFMKILFLRRCQPTQWCDNNQIGSRCRIPSSFDWYIFIDVTHDSKKLSGFYVSSKKLRKF